MNPSFRAENIGHPKLDGVRAHPTPQAEAQICAAQRPLDAGQHTASLVVRCDLAGVQSAEIVHAAREADMLRLCSLPLQAMYRLQVLATKERNAVCLVLHARFY
jgi:hypothetical protein